MPRTLHANQYQSAQVRGCSLIFSVWCHVWGPKSSQNPSSSYIQSQTKPCLKRLHKEPKKCGLISGLLILVNCNEKCTLGGLKEQSPKGWAWFVLFNDTWSKYGHSVSCMITCFLNLQITRSGHTWNGLSAWWLHMIISIFLRGLCGCVWVNILTLSPSKVWS